MKQPLLFELSDPGQQTSYLPPLDVPEVAFKYSTRTDLPLPEVDEHSLVRHYTKLSQKNFNIDTEFYPLGSCTMKYNPKLNEAVAALPGFAGAHPLLPQSAAQGWLQVLFEAQETLSKIAGLHAATVQPLAGAQGEFCGLLMIRKYHESRGEASTRTRIVVPDSAHGTNPASAARCGYSVTSVASDSHGCVDIGAMKKALGNDVAAVMITNPNTLGVFEKEIETLCQLAHEHGALVYMDGANMNAILGQVRPGDTGVDVMHFNVHKTFSTPHGGGGPGAGPVAVRDILEPFLPSPHVVKNGSCIASGATPELFCAL
jgi:glycine dehydrogenase subunit 2